MGPGVLHIHGLVSTRAILRTLAHPDTPHNHLDDLLTETIPRIPRPAV